MALLAMLATAPDGERTRNWLQDRLWGSRARPQAQQSLRRELAGLRTVFADNNAVMLIADRDRVQLNLQHIMLEEADRNNSIFLEGFDIPGEDGFEDWLRDERQRDIDFAQGAGRAAALPEKVVRLTEPAPGFGGRPALAILPFANTTNDADFDVWIEGFADDLTDRVARLRWLPVIAAATMHNLGETNSNAMMVRQRVGADYVLSGQIGRAAAGTSLRVRLTDGTNNQLLWSENYQLNGQFTPAIFDDLFARLVASLATRIDSSQQTKVVERRLDELTIDERVVRARWHMKRLTRQDAAIARKLLTEASELRPNAPEVLIELAYVMARDTWTMRDGADSINAFRAVAVRARDADPFEARAYLILGMAEMWLHRLDSAADLFREAISLNPSLADAHGHLGSNHSLAGRPDQAFAPLQTALRLSPYETEAFHQLGELALAHFMLGNFDEAVEHANFALARRPAYFYAHVIKINALIADGKGPLAKSAHARLLELKPSFKPTDIDWLPFADRSWIEKLKSGVVTAAR